MRCAGLLLLMLAACAPRTTGPDTPFDGAARPRTPEHYLVGNSFDLPLPFEVLQSFAVASGTPAMAAFDEQDWTRPAGSVHVEERDGRTHFTIALTGLVPGGLYTLWLVRVAGSGRGDKRDLALGGGYAGDVTGAVAGNAIVVGDDGTAVHECSLGPTDADPTGTAFGDLDLWDEIHVAFHADGRAYGPSPGPMHWTQAILPIHPDDGSARVALEPALNDTTLEQPGSEAELLEALRASGIALGAEWPGRFGESRGTFSLSQVALGTTREWWVMTTFDALPPGARISAWWVRGVERCPLGGAEGLFGAATIADGNGRGTVRSVLTPASPCTRGPIGPALGAGRVELLIHTRAEEPFSSARPADSWIVLAGG